jgi:hypothetical protein
MYVLTGNPKWKHKGIPWETNWTEVIYFYSTIFIYNNRRKENERWELFTVIQICKMENNI